VGTLLGLCFIVAAASAGVFVGTRPTVMDGRWIAAKLAKNAQEAGTAIECDRKIRVGVTGSEFACVHSRRGAHQRIWYRMSRDGSKLEITRTSRVSRDRGERRDRPAPHDDDGAGAPGDLDADADAGAEVED
jgi:hypothetical protein